MNLRRVADVGDPRNAPGTERDPLHDHIAKSKFYFVNSKEAFSGPITETF